jgi:hypothetical protein
MNRAVTSIRVLHHWACSGGTILSRCIAAHPDVVLLSEIHPLSYLRHQDAYPDRSSFYFPNDILWQLSLPNNGRDPALCLSMWNGAIDGLYSQLANDQKVLVIRSHSHVDFFTGIIAASESLVSRELGRRHPLKQLITVRHPLDSWLSLCHQGWQNHFRFSSFKEYCRRCLSMLDACSAYPLIRYEDFCIDPAHRFSDLCDILGLSKDIDALASIKDIKMSGNSGRNGNDVQPRQRRPMTDKLLQELKAASENWQSKNEHPYFLTCQRLRYNPDPFALHPFTTGSYHV